MDTFYQDPPRLPRPFADDVALRSLLAHAIPADVFRDVEPDLERFGDRVAREVSALGRAAEAEPPRLVTFDPWGRRTDRIEVSEAWRRLHRVSAEEGIVALAYERRHGAYSRIHQFAKVYLFHPPSAFYSCPLAMTDGAARVIELLGDAPALSDALARLTTRDPGRFWTSGQWMTERSGGSDVGDTETVARFEDGRHRLYGTKWFTSATTSEMAMTLARIEDRRKRTVPGSRGLSLFYLETHDAGGRLDRIEILRLKDKLGTRALPTAELTLHGTPARLLGEPGNGVRDIAHLLNLTRVHNAICSVATMRRAVALAADYASRRRAFGRNLDAQPLHLETLAGLEVETRGCLHLAFHAAALVGLQECGTATEDDLAVLRMLVPLAKLYTGKSVVRVVSEALEAFGGAGYVEDTGLPGLLRDAQVFPIWEGTTNVLSLDVLRAISKQQALAPFLDAIGERLARVTASALYDAAARARQTVHELEAWLPRASDHGEEAVRAGARAFSLVLARTFAAALLLEHAERLVTGGSDPAETAAAVTAARRWCGRSLYAPEPPSPGDPDEARRLVYAGLPDVAAGSTAG